MEEIERCCSAIGRMIVIAFVRILLTVILGLWSAGNIMSEAIILFYQMNGSCDKVLRRKLQYKVFFIINFLYILY